MKVIITTRFKDLTINDFREQGDIISVSNERYEEIKAFCEIYETTESEENTKKIKKTKANS